VLFIGILSPFFLAEAINLVYCCWWCQNNIHKTMAGQKQLCI